MKRSSTSEISNTLKFYFLIFINYLNKRRKIISNIYDEDEWIFIIIKSIINGWITSKIQIDKIINKELKNRIHIELIKIHMK
jgi:hypothetical protein